MLRAFGRDLIIKFTACYCGYRWLWHVLAAALTALLVLSGFDWWFFEQTRTDALQPLIWAAGLGGFFVPVLLPVALYWLGEWRGSVKLKHVGTALAQAEIIAIVISSVYKTFTGRVQPEFLTTFNTADISHQFLFGFLRHGIFWGWPSSHAAVACAGMAVLFLSLRNRFVRALCIAYALMISAGAAIGFHWFSDVVAGVIIGTLIGWSLSKSPAVY